MATRATGAANSVEDELDRLRESARRELSADVVRARVHAQHLAARWAERHSLLLIAGSAALGALAISRLDRRAPPPPPGACSNGAVAAGPSDGGADGASGGGLGSIIMKLARAWLTDALVSGVRG